jgi:hypothetical protein
MKVCGGGEFNPMVLHGGECELACILVKLHTCSGKDWTDTRLTEL